ncbi:hypothetical protein [Mesorhizobium sp. M2A.F.Ca.ET.037.01.1.1]|uniref:hypothetical protein n=1 Tax=Mesorhizobium sp. M2A.F.Ca.ET.037.01.1.1 TaxID=2496748 RepID=UPI0016768ACE|nr:hypothetical protein [Mesorhizobium sp. M2A.F.Ca.ET.037.01.1.1]
MIKTNAGDNESSQRVSILGAGRLGSALEGRLKSMGADVRVWSRRYESGDQPSLSSSGASGQEMFQRAAESNVLLSAIPNQALLALASRQQLRTFDGVVFAMGIDTTIQSVREVLARALVLRLSPAIPQVGGEITSIGLLDAHAANDPRVDLAKATLGLLGPVTWIDEEVLYDLTTLLAGPLLTLLKSTISQTVEASLRTHRLPYQFKDELERVVLKELVRRLVGSSESSQQAERERSTPGGVTEIALRHSEQISSQLLDIVELMLERMAHLRHQWTSQSGHHTPLSSV